MRHCRHGQPTLRYVSGSTGLPKCCPFEVGRAFVLQGPRIKSCGMKPGPNGDRWYNCMPFYHGTGHTVAVTCLTTGITLCIGRKFSTSGFWNDIRDSDATAMVYVGETVRYLLTPPPSPLDKQHRVKLAFGNGLRPDVWARFAERFGIETVAEIFNSTEGVLALQNICRGEYQLGAVGHQGAINRRKFHDIYIPVEIDYETGQMYRDPKTGFARRKPYEDGGEMLVRVPNEKAFVGYWNNPQATAKMFERNVFKKGDLFYRSGDALRRTPDGLWYFMDRLGDTYRWKSENVSTAEVSQVLGRASGVVEAIVYGVEVPGRPILFPMTPTFSNANPHRPRRPRWLCRPEHRPRPTQQQRFLRLSPRTRAQITAALRSPHIHPRHRQPAAHAQQQAEQGATQKGRYRPCQNRKR